MVIHKDAPGIAFGIVVLPGLERPDEGQESQAAQEQRDRDQDNEDFQGITLSEAR